jgi:hypothetical protein
MLLQFALVICQRRRRLVLPADEYFALCQGIARLTPPPLPQAGRHLLADPTFWSGMADDIPGRVTDHVAEKLGEASAKWAEERGAGAALQGAAGAAGPIFVRPRPAAALAAQPRARGTRQRGASAVL